MNLLPEPIAISQEIRTCTELRRQIHDDLRIQLPEWVKPNGKGPPFWFLQSAPHGAAPHFDPEAI
jgi:hypothetical protein